MKITEIFRQTLKHFLSEKPRGYQGQLADAIGVTRKHLNDYLGGRRQMNEEYREQIARYFGYEYEEFIAMGRKLFYKLSQEKEPSTPVEPLDRAVEILRLAEEKAGKKLNAKQREAVAKIIRKELKKRETEAMGNVVDMIKALQ